ncbi:MAG TPA: GNAT family protein [Caulobacteraceae bacterium]|nr:GNAT family protein [Caulobacteraceae bacterium]
MSAPAAVCAIALESAGVRLEPLAEDHRVGLRQAGQSPEIWAYMPYAARGRGFDAWFDHSLAAAASGAEAVWAVRASAEGPLVGSTRFLAIEAAHRRLEIGSTWYAPDAWGTRVNPACKLALMRYALEDLGFNRVEYKTDIRNERSQAAIAKLGALREGVFRAHMVRSDGTLRDSVYFSVIASEWPAVRARLAARLVEAV